MIALVSAAPGALAQTAPNDLVSRVILQLFREHNTKFVCLSEDSSLPVIRASVEAQLKAMPAGSSESQDTIATVIYSQYPCPFSPSRKGLRPATAKDIEGVWLFPEGSQELRFGPNSPSWQTRAASPVKCEAIAYYENAEARTVQIVGSEAVCAFAAAKDMNVSRRNPKVATWSLLRDGRLKIDRTDVQGHVEEWDVFLVEIPLRAGTITINSGDLVAYLRREKGNDLNVATMFRHLQKLP